MSLRAAGVRCISNEEAVRIISEAVILANATYAEMSGGLMLHDGGVEAYVSGQIAHSLYDEGRARGGRVFAVLEASFENIVEWSGNVPIRGAKPLALRRKGRVDVVYCDGDGSVAGLVEVKRHFGWSSLKADAERLVKILERCGVSRGGSVRWGCVVGFHSEFQGSKVAADRKLDVFCERFAASDPDYTIHRFIAADQVLVGSSFHERKLSGFQAPAMLFAPQAGSP